MSLLNCNCLGNKHLHTLTKDKQCDLRVNLVNWNNIHKYAKYRMLEMSDETDGYRLTLAHHSGTAGNSLQNNCII